MRAACLVLLTTLLSLPAAASQPTADSLFERMAGRWLGTGERTQAISGRKTRIDAQVQARVQDSTLYSHSEITETAVSGAARSYVREYWIRKGVSGSYEFGVGNKVTSVGTFDGTTLSVEQTLGREPGYIIRSRTVFDEQGSQYDESFCNGQKELARTHIEYRLANTSSL
ncbi:MAG: hypothetical protein HY074_10915 [Deltaproteobacteria bacterium]|nr:hypothetical protein [Deltaproteobacteria bacterium]